MHVLVQTNSCKFPTYLLGKRKRDGEGGCWGGGGGGEGVGGASYILRMRTYHGEAGRGCLSADIRRPKASLAWSNKMQPVAIYLDASLGPSSAAYHEILLQKFPNP